jgi:hypothetical protein
VLTYILNKTSLRVKKNLTCTWLATKDNDKLEMSTKEGQQIISSFKDKNGKSVVYS